VLNLGADAHPGVLIEALEERQRMNRSGPLTPSAMATLATTVTSFWEAYGEENPADLAFRHVHWLAITQGADGTLRYRDLAAV